MLNPRTGDDFVLGLKEITLPDGITPALFDVAFGRISARARRPVQDPVARHARLDPAWIGMKLRKLLDYPEPLGDFMAFVPGARKQQNFPSTISYMARLIIHRYAMLGILDEHGMPRQRDGHPRRRPREKQRAE